MGFDLYGENGSYFRASVWSWRPIHHVIITLVEDKKVDLPPETLLRMAYNDGARLDADQCFALADALQEWVEANKGIKEVAINPPDGEDLKVNDEGRFLTEDELGEGKTGRSPWHTDLDHFREFIMFLRNCGQHMEVW